MSLFYQDFLRFVAFSVFSYFRIFQQDFCSSNIFRILAMFRRIFCLFLFPYFIKISAISAFFYLRISARFLPFQHFPYFSIIYFAFRSLLFLCFIKISAIFASPTFFVISNSISVFNDMFSPFQHFPSFSEISFVLPSFSISVLHQCFCHFRLSVISV